MNSSKINKKNIDKYTIIKILSIVLFIVLIIVPFIFVLCQLGDSKISSIFENGLFGKSILNSIVVSLVTTIISMTFAFLFAYILRESNIRFKSFFALLFTLPMLIPSIAHGMELIIMFGKNGIVSHLFNTTFNIYGFTGVMLGSFLYSFPTAFIMFYDILKYEDKKPYLMADIMGIPKWRQFFSITLPYLKKTLITIFFATFTLVFTDYGVPMMVGGQFMTLPLFMYNEVIGQLNFGAGALSAIVLIVPAIIACILDIILKDKTATIATDKSIEIKKSKGFNIFTYTACIVCVLIILIPIIAFGIIGIFKKYPLDPTLSSIHFEKLFNIGIGRFIFNSIVMSMLTAMIGTVFSTTMAYLTARTKKNVSNKMLHTLALISMAIPGVVLGIAYLLMYGGTAFSQSIFILVILNIVHFFSSPYLMSYNAFNKINKNYEIVAETLKINKFHFFKNILFPEIENTMLDSFSYMFINSMVTISAVSFLATAKNMPLSLLINQLENQALLECAAIISVFILLINILEKSIVYIIKRLNAKKNK